MALPQKVIEQLEREPPKTPGWSGRLLMFSSAIFFICAAFYVGLAYGYAGYLRNEIFKVNQEIQTFGEQVPLADQLSLIAFYSQLANVDMLLANQIVGTRAFDWIEKNTQTNVHLSGMNVDYVGSTVSASPVAKTMSDALQQLVNLYGKPEVKEVTVGGISQAGEQKIGSRWGFGLNLKLDPGYFARVYKPRAVASTTPSRTP